MKRFTLLLFSIISVLTFAINPYKPTKKIPQVVDGQKLVFSEEFNYTGKPDSAIWNYEQGFKRNNELQWYQPDNANCSNGRLLIEGRKTNFPNPNFVANSKDWRANREFVQYTAASITTSKKKSWLYGRFEVRARIDTTMGSWPAIWLLGSGREWPACGEIDMMEFYRHEGKATVLANVAWGGKGRFNPIWDSFRKPLSELVAKDKKWEKKFHVWRMDWTPTEIRLYLDDVLYNSTLLSETINADGSNPFKEHMYILLNLALGSNGGTPDDGKFPIKYEVDYVRVYQ
jgi:beta-glucanase (GH16 family)